MTRQQWLDLADRYQEQANEEFEHGDELYAEFIERKASASRFCACYGTEEEPVEEVDT
jgi:hypothetical protein